MNPFTWFRQWRERKARLANIKRVLDQIAAEREASDFEAYVRYCERKGQAMVRYFRKVA